MWKRELLEQWKDANLLEMESSCLPSNLATQRVVKLPGKYGLQVRDKTLPVESLLGYWIIGYNGYIMHLLFIIIIGKSDARYWRIILQPVDQVEKT